MKIYNFTLEELREIEELSVRTFNICEYNQLKDILSILTYFLENKNFKNLRNCGNKSQLELLRICQKYKNLTNSIEKEEEDTLITLIDEKLELKDQQERKKVENFNILQLYEAELMSERTYEYCIENSLNSLGDLIVYFKKEGNFLHLGKHKNKENFELLTICRKYKNYEIIKTISLNPPIDKDTESDIVLNNISVGIDGVSNLGIDELSIIENLSKRTHNICKYNGLSDLHKILKYYHENETFLNLRNCGLKTHFELVNIYQKYNSVISFNDKDENKDNLILNTIENLSVRQKQVINNKIDSKLKSLSVRGLNALKLETDNNLTLNGFKDLFTKSKSELQKIQFVGRLTVTEIEFFIDEIKEYIQLVAGYENDKDIFYEIFKTYLLKNFPIHESKLSEIYKTFDFANGLPIFKILDLLIDNFCLYNERDTALFKIGFDFYNGNETLSLYELAEVLKITKERTRQLKVGIYESLNSTFNIVGELEFCNLNNYGIDTNSDLIIIENDIENEINKTEMTNFTSLFIVKIFSILLSKNYSLVGDEYGILFDKISRQKHNWVQTYLVAKKFTDKFNFISFIDNVNSRLNEKIDEDYYFHFQTYLLNFQINDCRTDIDSISTIAEYMLFQEFGLTINLDEQIHFKRNTTKPIIEYVIEVLDEVKRPLTVYELYDIVEKKSPGITKSAVSLRGSLGRSSNIIFFGRSSTYGLKSWENNINIKGGTIREIVEEYLELQEVPIHIDTITKYVNQYRTTNSKNIYTNLRLQDDKRFKFYKNSLIGLSSKKYHTEEFILTKEVFKTKNSFEDNLSKLEAFTQTYNRLPTYTNSEEEAKLYRFLNLQIRKAYKVETKTLKEEKIIEIISKYDYVKSERLSPYKTDELYNRLLSFIKMYKRLPIPRINDEKKLYRFFYKQRKQFSDKNLPNEFIDKHIEIINTLKEYNENREY